MFALFSFLSGDPGSSSWKRRPELRTLVKNGFYHKNTFAFRMLIEKNNTRYQTAQKIIYIIQSQG
jgi:hypothetical protein